MLLVDDKGEKQGVVDIAVALGRAQAAGLDLVEVSPNSAPPVCRLLDYGKWKYQLQKKQNRGRKKQKTVTTKEVKLRPNIDTHDYEVKLQNILRFLKGGDKVKVTLFFRGREITHRHLGMDLLLATREKVVHAAKVEMEPKMDRRQIIMVLSPR